MACGVVPVSWSTCCCAGWMGCTGWMVCGCMGATARSFAGVSRWAAWHQCGTVAARPAQGVSAYLIRRLCLLAAARPGLAVGATLCALVLQWCAAGPTRGDRPGGKSIIPTWQPPVWFVLCTARVEDAACTGRLRERTCAAAVAPASLFAAVARVPVRRVVAGAWYVPGDACGDAGPSTNDDDGPQ
jgi:hypothetical protein